MGRVTLQPQYPFVPRSTAYLLPGQFWAIPLLTGHFACGRVLDVDGTRPRGRRAFSAGLMGWSGDHPPTSADLEGVTDVVHEGDAHILAITSTGGEILGHRPLGLEGIEPQICVDVRDRSASLFCGFRRLRPATDDERRELPQQGVLGFKVLEYLAEQMWGNVEAYRRRHNAEYPSAPLG
jgi:hypothetical protein